MSRASPHHAPPAPARVDKPDKPDFFGAVVASDRDAAIRWVLIELGAGPGPLALADERVAEVNRLR